MVENYFEEKNISERVLLQNAILRVEQKERDGIYKTRHFYKQGMNTEYLTDDDADTYRALLLGCIALTQPAETQEQVKKDIDVLYNMEFEIMQGIMTQRMKNPKLSENEIPIIEGMRQRFEQYDKQLRTISENDPSKHSRTLLRAYLGNKMTSTFGLQYLYDIQQARK